MEFFRNVINKIFILWYNLEMQSIEIMLYNGDINGEEAIYLYNKYSETIKKLNQ